MKVYVVFDKLILASHSTLLWYIESFIMYVLVIWRKNNILMSNNLIYILIV